MIKTIESIIREHPFFRDLDQDFLRTVVGCASNVYFRAGQTIFSEGQEANQFYLLRDGKVAIEFFVPGRGSVTLQTLEGGEVLGWSWLFPPYRWNFDARAIEATRAFALDGKCLRNKCEENHDLGYDLMKRSSLIIAERLQATRVQFIDIYGTVGEGSKG